MHSWKQTLQFESIIKTPSLFIEYKHNKFIVFKYEGSEVLVGEEI